MEECASYEHFLLAREKLFAIPVQDFTLSLFSVRCIYKAARFSGALYIRVFLHNASVRKLQTFFATPVAFVRENIVSFKDFTPNKFPLFVANPYFFFVPIFWNF